MKLKFLGVVCTAPIKERGGFMNLFNVLVSLVLILLVAYVTFIALYRTLFNTSLDDAEKYVNNLIKSWFDNNILHKNSQNIEPPPDDILVAKLLDILAKVNLLDKDSTLRAFRLDWGFPVIQFDIVASDDADLDFLAIQLEKVTLNYLLQCRYIDPLVYVYWEKHGSAEYYVFVCYAVHEAAKNALRAFIGNKAGLTRKEAIKRERPIINDDLEKEIEDMKEDEKNE